MSTSGRADAVLHRDPPRVATVLSHDSPVVRILRVLFGMIGFSTVIINIFIVANLPEGLHLPNYLSFFTNEVNLFAGAVLVLSGALPRDRLPRWWDGLRGAAAVYLSVTFVVFALLLENSPAAGTITPWVNFVVHRLMPVVLVLDWLLIPASSPARWWRPLAWIAYPVLFVVYSLLRGSVVDWYPYPFLDPRGPEGYASLIASAGAVFVGSLAAALLFDQLGRLRRRLAPRAAREAV
ncbi:Pr6Pr family membrane protein [Naasia sp. SYSU D00948]|uniref:Pr6Pr family membrane protein n=1 Tax=Naasia sp. SYSU D00948 TaxID=2817379 RepID=UPI001B303A91|nr:Pr6Pr family membrane protein [Naasia sp. SYSU D00948]